MKKSILLGLILLLGTFSYAAAVPVSYGFIDFQKVLKNYTKYQDAQKLYEGYAQPYQEQVEAEKQKLQKLQDTMRKNMLSSEEVKKKNQEELQKAYQKYQVFLKDVQDKLKSKEAQLLEPLKVELENTIEQTAKEKGFSIIYDMSAQNVIYVDENLDISQAVIQALQK